MKLRYYTILLCLTSFFFQCKSDKQTVPNTSNKAQTTAQVEDDGIVRDTFHYISAPKMTGWNLISQSLNYRDTHPPGYKMLDSLCYTHHSGKSFLMYTLGEQMSDSLNLDFKVVFDYTKGLLPGNEDYFNKMNIASLPMYEMKFGGEELNVYKLLVPKDNQLIQLEIMTQGPYSEELQSTIDQLPSLIRTYK